MRRSLSLICSSTVAIHPANSEMERAETSAMFLPATRNWSASFFRREPPQTEQVR